MNIIEKLLDRRIKDNVRLGRAFALALMATTFFFANQFAMQKVGQLLPAALVEISPYVAIALAFAVSYMVDHRLFQNTTEAFTALMSKGWGRLPRQARIGAYLLVFVVSARFMASTGMTIASVYFASSSAVAEDYKAADAKASVVNKEAASARKQIDAIRADYLKRAQSVIDRAEQQAKAKEENALSAGGSNWRKLYEGEDPYLMSTSRADIAKYRKGIAAARKEGDAIRFEAQKEHDRLMALADKQIASVQEISASSISVGSAGYQNAANTAGTKALIFSSFGWVLDFLFAGMTLLLSYLIALWASSQPDPDKALDEIFEKEHGIFDVLTAAIKAVQAMIVAWLTQGTSALSLAGAKQMSTAAAKLKEATSERRTAKQMYSNAWRATARTTPEEAVQQQYNSSTTAGHGHPAYEEERYRGEEAESLHSTAPAAEPVDNAEEEEKASTSPTPSGQEDVSEMQQYNTFYDSTTPDTTVQQYNSTTVQQQYDTDTTAEGVEQAEGSEEDVIKQKKARQTNRRDAITKLRRQRSSYSSRAKKYMQQARQQQDLKEKQRLVQLAKDNVQRAKEFELKITNLQNEH